MNRKLIHRRSLLTIYAYTTKHSSFWLVVLISRFATLEKNSAQENMQRMFDLSLLQRLPVALLCSLSLRPEVSLCASITISLLLTFTDVEFYSLSNVSLHVLQ